MQEFTKYIPHSTLWNIEIRIVQKSNVTWFENKVAKMSQNRLKRQGALNELIVYKKKGGGESRKSPSPA